MGRRWYVIGVSGVDSHMYMHAHAAVLTVKGNGVKLQDMDGRE